MKIYITFTRKNLVLIICVLLIFMAFFSKFSSVSATNQNGKTNKDRISFLENLGLEVYSNPSSLKTQKIPEVFSDVYTNYNEIQKSANFDLSAYKGENCDFYSYKVISFGGKDEENMFANLIIYKDRIIGGDISSVAIDGKMYPLLKQNGKTTT